MPNRRGVRGQKERGLRFEPMAMLLGYLAPTSDPNRTQTSAKCGQDRKCARRCLVPSMEISELGERKAEATEPIFSSSR